VERGAERRERQQQQRRLEHRHRAPLDTSARPAPRRPRPRARRGGVRASSAQPARSSPCLSGLATMTPNARVQRQSGPHGLGCRAERWALCPLERLVRQHRCESGFTAAGTRHYREATPSRGYLGRRPRADRSRQVAGDQSGLAAHRLRARPPAPCSRRPSPNLARHKHSAARRAPPSRGRSAAASHNQ
jgi:hypothetical protein